MSLSPQSLSQKDLNLLRNDRIKFECSPMVYQNIIEWGFQKPDGVKIKDHMTSMKIQEKSGLKLEKWFKKFELKLDETNFSSFDVTFLHDLLPILCYEKVSQHFGKEWVTKLKDNNSIEYLLNEIKSFRNDVSHEYSKAKDDPNIENKKDLMEKCIRTAGTLYGKDQSEIDAKVANLNAKFDELVRETTSSYENAVNHVTKLVEKEIAPFMLKRYSPLFTVPLPNGLGNIQSPEIFQSVNLSVKGDSSKTVFSSTEICNHVNNKFVVINGGPGSGKTTLMRNIFQNILDSSVNRSGLSYEGIERFKVPIYLECRTERQNNLREFLKESIPNLNSPKEVIYDAFKEVKGQVFLIDGYDEVNDDSRKLITEIIPFCSKYEVTCIVSGRIDAGNNFISILKDRNMSYNEMLVEPMSEMSDKVGFLTKYGDKIGDDVDSKELVNSFKNLNDASHEVFYSPAHLALFISLFLNNRNCLSQLQNEQSIYKAIREMFCNEIKRKLKESNVKNAELRTEDILAVLYDYSLRLFVRKKFFFDRKDFLSLMRECEKVLSRDVDIEGLLTCILTPETSLKLGKSLSYSFTHSTIQEYLAVGQINKKIRERNIDWNSKQISEDILRENFFESFGIFTSHYDATEEVKRYGNIIKLLILEKLDEGELSEHTKTVIAVLGKYFRPEYENSPDYLLDLVLSSNCDSAIATIVSNALVDESDYNKGCYSIYYTRHIRPMIELLKENSFDIYLNFSESLSDTTLATIGKLMLMLKENNEMMLYFDHSYRKFQPLSEEFYTQLKSIKCKVTYIRACVTTPDHLDIVRKVWRGHKLCISILSASDVSFAFLQGYKKLWLKVKYTKDFPSTGSNPGTGKTKLRIADIPTDGGEDLFNIIKYLRPKSNEFKRINLVNCHLTDTDTKELLKKLEGEKITTKEGEETKVKERWVNGDGSKDLLLYLRGIK